MKRFENTPRQRDDPSEQRSETCEQERVADSWPQHRANHGVIRERIAKVAAHGGRSPARVAYWEGLTRPVLPGQGVDGSRRDLWVEAQLIEEISWGDGKQAKSAHGHARY